jgi:hypothetical protein
MKEILEAKLKQFNIWLEDLDMPGYEWTLGQRDLCEELLSIYIHKEEAYDTQEYYDGCDDEYWSIDEWSDHLNELEYYKQQEIDNLYDVFNQHSWWIGKNVMNTDSMWFTSDEIEAFREIWQRRLSA